MVMKVMSNFFKYCSWSVLVFACHVIILSWITTAPEFFFATLVIIKKLTDNLLTISVIFTWFYKTENIMMQQIHFGSHQTSWNISSAILKVLLLFKACLKSLLSYAINEILSNFMYVFTWLNSVKIPLSLYTLFLYISVVIVLLKLG